MYLLRLDHDGVYFGAVEIPEDYLAQEGDVVLDHAPDNPPGRYRWSVADQRLDPLPPHLTREAEAPGLERALYELLVCTHEGNPAGVPSASIAWARQYETTIDAMIGNVDQPGAPRLDYFKRNAK